MQKTSFEDIWSAAHQPFRGNWDTSPVADVSNLRRYKLLLAENSELAKEVPVATGGWLGHVGTHGLDICEGDIASQHTQETNWKQNMGKSMP